MLRWLFVVGVLCLVGQAAWAQTPATFAGLKKEYDKAQVDNLAVTKKLQAELTKAMQAAETAAEKQELAKKFQAGMPEAPGVKFAPRFVAFAESNSKDPAAIDALAMALRIGGPAITKSGLRVKILAMLRTDYIASPDMKKVVRSAVSLGDELEEQFVRDLIAKNPDRKVQGKAIKNLAKSMRGAAGAGERMKDSEKIRADVEKRYGKEFADKLVANADKMMKSADEWDEIAKKKYADVFPDLSVGKLAPEVINKDLNDKEVKLSALKGKVVVLDVWATWCGPCRAMIPHEREMVERLKDKPFALVSISTDEKKQTLTDFLSKEPMPWTHWWNGNDGGILEDWEITSYPTIYVLDATGVIRFKNIRGEKLENAVKELLKELETKGN